MTTRKRKYVVPFAEANRGDKFYPLPFAEANRGDKFYPLPFAEGEGEGWGGVLWFGGAVAIELPPPNLPLRYAQGEETINPARDGRWRLPPSQYRGNAVPGARRGRPSDAARRCSRKRQ